MSGSAAARARTIAAGAGPDARPREDQLAGARPVWVDGMTLRASGVIAPSDHPTDEQGSHHIHAATRAIT
jgi:hypothetical protein